MKGWPLASMRFRAGDLAGDSGRFLEAAGIQGRRINTPTASQQANPFCVVMQGIVLAELRPFGPLGVIVAPQAEFHFGSALATLVPNGFAGPGVGPLHLPML